MATILTPFARGTRPHDPEGEGSEGLVEHEILYPSEPDPDLGLINRGFEKPMSIDAEMRLGWFDVRHAMCRPRDRQRTEARYERERRRVLAMSKRVRYKLIRKEVRNGEPTVRSGDGAAAGADPGSGAPGGEGEDPELAG